MQIILINRYFYPDHSATSQMLSDLAFALADRRKHVSIITSCQLYDSPEIRLPNRETISGVTVYRVVTSRFGRHKLIGRAVDYLTFYLSAAWTLWRIARRGDIVVVKTDPPMLSIVTAPIARLRQANLVNWLQDLFPEVLEVLDSSRKSIRRIAYNFIGNLRNQSLKRAQLNIVIGERMAEKLKRLGVPPERIGIIHNWAHGSQFITDTVNPLRREWNLEAKFVVCYSGNLGRAHDVDTFIEAITLLELDSNLISPNKREGIGKRHNIAWLFIGGGVLYQRLQTEATTRGFTSVHFFPYQPRERLAESLSVPDVHLLSLKPELEGLIVPSKYYGIAAAGRPAIFVGDADGEIARILKAKGTGKTVKPGDGAGLATLIQTFASNPALTAEMGRRARYAFEQNFDFPIALLAWEKALAAARNNLPNSPLKKYRSGVKRLRRA